MRVAIFDNLPAQARQIRQEVFVEEQGFQSEFDEVDKSATHLLIFDQDQAIATCRYYYDFSLNAYLVGRIAVIKAYRGKQIGALLMQAAQKEIDKKGKRKMLVHAQTRAQLFYEKQGFTAFGEIDDDEGCPHIWMKKEW